MKNNDSLDTDTEITGSEPAPIENCGTQAMRRSSPRRAYFYGVIAAFAVVGIYLTMNTLAADWYFARMQFADYRWWIITLAIGLGIQVAMFTAFRAYLRGVRMKAATTSIAATGGVSTAAMMACCSHYLAAILPALGIPFLSASAVANVAEYQVYFFAAGVASCLFGIGLMLRLMAKHGALRSGPAQRFFLNGLKRMKVKWRYGNGHA